MCIWIFFSFYLFIYLFYFIYLFFEIPALFESLRKICQTQGGIPV